MARFGSHLKPFPATVSHTFRLSHCLSSCVQVCMSLCVLFVVLWLHCCRTTPCLSLPHPSPLFNALKPSHARCEMPLALVESSHYKLLGTPNIPVECQVWHCLSFFHLVPVCEPYRHLLHCMFLMLELTNCTVVCLLCICVVCRWSELNHQKPTSGSFQ